MALVAAICLLAGVVGVMQRRSLDERIRETFGSTQAFEVLSMADSVEVYSVDVGARVTVNEIAIVPDDYPRRSLGPLSDGDMRKAKALIADLSNYPPPHIVKDTTWGPSVCLRFYKPDQRIDAYLDFENDVGWIVTSAGKIHGIITDNFSDRLQMLLIPYLGRSSPSM